MPEGIKPLKTDALLLPETKTQEEGMLIDKPEEGGEEIPTVIIPTDPIGAPETNTIPISKSALEELAKEGSLVSVPQTASKYWFEYTISGRTFPYHFDPEKRALKICRGSGDDGKPLGNIQILHNSVSREGHAMLKYNPKGNECLLRDVGSKNGTYFYNEETKEWKRIEKDEWHVLRDKEKLKFGAAEFVYRENQR